MFHLINRILAPRRFKPEALYRQCVAQARLPVFYRHYGVADTPDGRFDCVILHVILCLHVLNHNHSALNRYRDPIRRFGQELIEVMLEDWDHNLREMAVGDLAIPKRIKAALKAFYGRMRAYETGMDDTAKMRTALKRNLYRKITVDESVLKAMADYVLQQSQTLAEVSLDALCAGDFTFSVPPEPSS